MKWNNLNSIAQLDLIDEMSLSQPQVIFKHSTRCGVSISALKSFEKEFPKEFSGEVYYLDLLNNRDVSDEIAERYSVVHESPQVLAILDKKCIYHESHSQIDWSAILKELIS
ncbi:MAG: bacillithiol system redox-active protein YtxJ [Bacteroidia bacterium]